MWIHENPKGRQKFIWADAVARKAVMWQTVIVADSLQALINLSKVENKLTLVVCGFVELYNYVSEM